MENNEKYKTVEEASKIYLLPNIFTAGNMFCGFLSLCSCIEAKYAPNQFAANDKYMTAVYFIFGACIFDLFDGRVARLFKKESLFGLEFDSIADTVSFGVAPAFLVYFLILDPSRSVDLFNGFLTSAGPIIGFIYLLCAGIRLAKFNVLSTPLLPREKDKNPSENFMGIPSPVAAAITASFVLLLTNLSKTENNPEILKNIKEYLPLILLPTMLLVSILMITNIPYPTFKKIDWNSKTKAKAFILVALFIICAIKFHIYVIPIALLAYLLFGIIRAIKNKIYSKSSFEEDTF